VFVPKGNGTYSIRPSYSSDLALTIKGGGRDLGTPLVLAVDKGLDWQLWSIVRNSNGKFSILSKYASVMGVDDFCGAKNAGAKLDIWAWSDNDEHLQWSIVNMNSDVTTDVPKGRMTQGAFNQSRIFPGTTRAYWVYVPAQYDGSKPACVYVQQDGYRGFEASVFDDLIKSGDMPVTVGIFVTSGNLPAPSGMDTPERPNRSFEYDSLGDNYVRFLTEELLPYITRRERLNLSTDGNDRCIGGASSGGICAFNAAWERPGAFRRVFANSGSFADFRGGNEFPTLIRKYEGKPIRAYLTTGTNDMENCAGDWTLLDMEVDKSLTFSGYDHEFHKIEGGHCAGWGPAQLADAMRFLWKGWPEPVKAGAGAPRSQDILIPGEQWQLLPGGYKNAINGGCNSKGEVFFTDISGNCVYRIGLDGRVATFIPDSGHASGLSFGPHDELFTVSDTTGTIMRYDASGKGIVYAQGIRGRNVVAKPEGGLYVTGTDSPEKPEAVWLVDQSRKTLVDSAPGTPTGLAITPDRWLLDVADGRSKWIYSYKINSDGTLINRERFFRLYVPDSSDDAGAGALCYDKEGHLFAATCLGIQVCANDGPVQVIIPVPGGRVTGMCLGGPEMNTLFAFCGDKIYSRKVKSHALGAFTPWTKMTPSKL
jgi:sugar lactone lactonase YvrE/enterochelin esterase-like enzyme